MVLVSRYSIENSSIPTKESEDSLSPPIPLGSQHELKKKLPVSHFLCSSSQEESSSATLSAFARGTKKKEGDLRKADEAEEYYKQWVHEANARQRELENTKSKVLLELRQLVYQCDQTMKAVSV